MKQLFLFLGICTTCNLNVNAQQLQNTLKKMQSLQNVTYTEVLKDKMSFSDATDIETLKAEVKLVPGEPQTGGYYKLKRDSDIDIYDGQKSIWLNLRDSTYRIQKEAITGQATRTLLYWHTEMKGWRKTPSKIKLLKDTVINSLAYDHYLFIQLDSAKKGEHVYSIIDVVINKITHLPFSITWKLKDFFDDGALGGWTEEHFYSNYEFNRKNFPDLSLAVVPANFKLPQRREIPVPLAIGTVAPKINLYDKADNNFELDKLKGKIVLLNFTTNGCPHCINATQMLTRMHQKYANVAIVSIYQLGVNSKESITKFDQKFNVAYPSYLTEKTAEAIYHLSGYPNFYLLDKQGIIVKSYDGFYAELEKELSDTIDKVK
jgi:thiol-disulfide isomerase/thioredoxin